MIWPNTTYQILLPRYSALSQPYPYCLLHALPYLLYPWKFISMNQNIHLPPYSYCQMGSVMSFDSCWLAWVARALFGLSSVGRGAMVSDACHGHTSGSGWAAYLPRWPRWIIPGLQSNARSHFLYETSNYSPPPPPPPIEFSLVWVPVTCMAIFILWCRTSSCVNRLS